MAREGDEQDQAEADESDDNDDRDGHISLTHRPSYGPGALVGGVREARPRARPSWAWVDPAGAAVEGQAQRGGARYSSQSLIDGGPLASQQAIYRYA